MIDRIHWVQHAPTDSRFNKFTASLGFSRFSGCSAAASGDASRLYLALSSQLHDPAFPKVGDIGQIAAIVEKGIDSPDPTLAAIKISIAT